MDYPRVVLIPRRARRRNEMLTVAVVVVGRSFRWPNRGVARTSRIEIGILRFQRSTVIRWRMASRAKPPRFSFVYARPDVCTDIFTGSVSAYVHCDLD